MTVPYITSYDKTVPFSDTTANMCLVANTLQIFTIPGADNKKYSMRFCWPTAAENVFVGYNNSATIPADGAIDLDNGIEFRPFGQRYVRGGDVISFITPDAKAYFGVSLRAIPNN